MPPPFGRFLAVRFREHHEIRATYGADIDVRHEAFMRPRGFGPEDEAIAHVEPIRGRWIALRDHEPDEGAICDRLDMVRQRGALPIPPRLPKPRWGNIVRRSTSGRHSEGIQERM